MRRQEIEATVVEGCPGYKLADQPGVCYFQFKGKMGSLGPVFSAEPGTKVKITIEPIEEK